MGLVSSFFPKEGKMNQAIIQNVARHPAHMLNLVLARPALIGDESLATVEAVAKIWAREGLADRVTTLVDASGLSGEARALLRRICARSMTVVH